MGALAVQPAENRNPEAEEEQLELIEPRFVGKVSLDTEQSEQLRTGQMTTVRLRAARGNIGQYLYRNVSQWFDRRLRQAQSG